MPALQPRPHLLRRRGAQQPPPARILGPEGQRVPVHAVAQAGLLDQQALGPGQRAGLLQRDVDPVAQAREMRAQRAQAQREAGRAVAPLHQLAVLGGRGVPVAALRLPVEEGVQAGLDGGGGGGSGGGGGEDELREDADVAVRGAQQLGAPCARMCATRPSTAASMSAARAGQKRRAIRSSASVPARPCSHSLDCGGVASAELAATSADTAPLLVAGSLEHVCAASTARWARPSFAIPQPAEVDGGAESEDGLLDRYSVHHRDAVFDETVRSGCVCERCRKR
ncbi:MAG: hypothetical protein LQ340_008134 [Diploschistes diacapsis]|nr:MAG: hypothetical protein LQ340_008134 [Diploschistes diacapsis]